MQVRPATPSDLPRLCAALVEMPLLRRYRHTAVSLVADLETGRARGERVLVAEVGRGVAGLAWLVPGGTFGIGGYLRLIAVRADVQRRGVGSALLEAFEAIVGTTGRHAFLLVSDFNSDAQRFYVRHGYAQVGALPRLVLPDVDELIYWKRVA